MTGISSRPPFGDPDASRGGLEDFIDFDGMDGIATREDDLRARVIVGRKGAGKTLYLRRARAFANNSHDLYADDIQQNLPSTTDIVRVANLYPKGVLVEKWMAIWRCAILRSLASHMLCNARLGGDRLSEPERERLRQDFPAVMRAAAQTTTPLSVYSQVNEIIRDPAFSARWLDQMVSHRQWEELEYTLGDLLDRYPPICFYIDAIDDEFRHAPAFWLMCQKGLFYQVMRQLRDTRLGARLHIFICIRDHVYTSVFGGEHATRYLDPYHIRLLEWDSPSIAYFLEQKIGRLDPTLRPRGDSVAAWLGTDYVHNERRDIDEPTLDYVLRHTRLLPRDIVNLGNVLCQRMQRRSAIAKRLTDKEIRAAVHYCAALFGREQLEICANQISADMMHEGAALQQISEIYTNTDPTFTGADTYQESVREKLSRFLQGIGRDRFDRETFARSREEGRRLFDGYTDVMAVLWQNGLLGLIPEKLEDGRAIFYSAAGHHELWIEDAAPQYAFHPCLIDALNLKSDGPGSLPVCPVAYDEI